MHRAYLSIAAVAVPTFSDSDLFGQLAQKLPFAIEPTQSEAWQYQIKQLRELATEIPSAHFFREFLIPRMGRRTDLIIILSGVIFVVEYKLGASHFTRYGIEQVYGYGLDLKHFHEASHTRYIVPILVATAAKASADEPLRWDEDGLARPLKALPQQLASSVIRISKELDAPALDPLIWLHGRYRPTPTIVEAAQALYRGHNVAEISRSEAGTENLTRTSEYAAQVIECAKESGYKVICFITGVPGSGKTLAGLNLATARQRAHSDEHAVFLSGNGPLVEVLREALALDAVAEAREVNRSTSKTEEDRRAAAFIQNIHHFRDDALASGVAPNEKVAVFDEAQRAWDVDQTSKFMQQKRGQISFSMSEPEFLLSVMDRHKDWCAIICLVGGGQEINTGEAGIDEWLRALNKSFPHWRVHVPQTLIHTCLIENEVLAPDLHLATSIRSFRAERLSDFVGHVIDGDASAAASIRSQLLAYPLLITRDLEKARNWLRSQRRGNERAGILASSNAVRLKPHGIFVKARVEPAKWFLAPSDDVRCSDALEDAATEFDVQGLEIDWACLCWDANFRYDSDWKHWRFKGSQWESINDPARRAHLANSYRVLLTRARQGVVVFVPQGSDEDLTRSPALYQGTYDFLTACGFDPL
jgi:hypothetical protein